MSRRVWKFVTFLALLVLTVANISTSSRGVASWLGSVSISFSPTTHIVSSTEIDDDTVDREWRPSKDWIANCTLRAKTSKRADKPFRVLWRRYTLGDCIKLCRHCILSDCIRNPWKTKRRGTGCFQQVARNDTLAALYYYRACRGNKNQTDGGNLTLVEDLLREEKLRHTQYDIPDPDTTVLHLRLGDVIENSRADVTEMLWNGADPWHSEEFRTSIKSISEYLTDLAESDSRFVAIRGGLHDPNHYRKSRIYTSCLQQALHHAGYRSKPAPNSNSSARAVEMVIEGVTPDEDFVFLSNSKRMMVSAGGYSKLVGTLVKRGGGEVIGREFG